MRAFAIYIAAAVAEIGGCFAFWAWLRLGRSVLWAVEGARPERDDRAVIRLLGA